VTDAATARELLVGARVLAAHGLVDAFGHVSARVDGARALITPARPLGTLADPAELLELPLDAQDLPAGVPREAWIHLALYRADPAVGAVCRAQPPSTLAAGAVASALPALHGQGALVGAAVPVFDDARLVRDAPRGGAVAARRGEAGAIVLRGNGAVTVGASVGDAVARMVLLERMARVYLAARAAGGGAEPPPLRAEEAAAWAAAAPELLARLWAHLSA